MFERILVLLLQCRYNVCIHTWGVGVASFHVYTTQFTTPVNPPSVLALLCDCASMAFRTSKQPFTIVVLSHTCTYTQYLEASLCVPEPTALVYALFDRAVTPPLGVDNCHCSILTTHPNQTVVVFVRLFAASLNIHTLRFSFLYNV